MEDRSFYPRERAVVKEGDPRSDVAQRRSAKLVAVVRVMSHLLEAVVFVSARSIESNERCFGNELRHGGYVPGKVAEHLIRSAGD